MVKKVPPADLTICTNNVKLKTRSFFEKAQEKGNKFLTFQLGDFTTNDYIGLHNREQIRLEKNFNDDAQIWCNLLDPDYQRHFYIRNRKVARTNLLDHFKTDGSYILIFEQIMPEGLGHDIFTHNGWKKWLIKTVKFIHRTCNLPIIVRRHPNRHAWPWFKNQSIKGDFIVSDGKTLEEDLSDARCTISISSRGSIEAVLNGIPSYIIDKNSPIYDCAAKTIKNAILAPTKFDREQWLKDISFSYWTLQEIKNGDYFNFLV